MTERYNLEKKQGMYMKKIMFTCIIMVFRAVIAPDYPKSFNEKQGIRELKSLFMRQNEFMRRLSNVHQEKLDTFMQGLRNLSSGDKNDVLRLMDEEAFAPNIDRRLAIHEEIEKIWKKNRLHRYGDFTTIRFVLKGEQESRSEDGERYAQQEISQNLECNVYGEMSEFELERRAHRQEFEEFVVGLKAMGVEDRDQVLKLLDKAKFDTSLSTSQNLKLFEQVDNVLHRNKIRRVAGIDAVGYILEKEKAKQS